MGKFACKKARYRVHFGISILRILHLDNDYGSYDSPKSPELLRIVPRRNVDFYHNAGTTIKPPHRIPWQGHLFWEYYYPLFTTTSQ